MEWFSIMIQFTSCLAIFSYLPDVSQCNLAFSFAIAVSNCFSFRSSSCLLTTWNHKVLYNNYNTNKAIPRVQFTLWTLDNTLLQMISIHTYLTLNSSPLDGDFCWKKASTAYLDATSLPKGFTKPVKKCVKWYQRLEVVAGEPFFCLNPVLAKICSRVKCCRSSPCSYGTELLQNATKPLPLATHPQPRLRRLL